jgi:hypothetical protein
MTETSAAACANGHPLNEPSGLALEHRKPCPCCGSTARQYSLLLQVATEPTVTVQHAISQRLRASIRSLLWLRLKQKRPGVGGFIVEVVDGWELRKAVGDFVRKFRRIDRGTKPKWYRERIELETGEVTRDVSEPLKNHQNRGSAKPKP